jgi:hypothetical protein
MARLCGATLGLFAFSITIFLSLSSHSLEETIGRALTAMFVFCGMGLVVGWIAGRVLDEYALARKRELLGEEPPTGAGRQQTGVLTGQEATQ